MRLLKIKIIYKNVVVGKVKCEPALVIPYTTTEKQMKEQIRSELKLDFILQEKIKP